MTLFLPRFHFSSKFNKNIFCAQYLLIIIRCFKTISKVLKSFFRWGNNSDFNDTNDLHFVLVSRERRRDRRSKRHVMVSNEERTTSIYRHKHLHRHRKVQQEISDDIEICRGCTCKNLSIIATVR